MAEFEEMLSKSTVVGEAQLMAPALGFPVPELMVLWKIHIS